METRVNYPVVGVFVIVLITLLVAGVLWLSAGGLWRVAHDYYLVYTTESVSGLNVNAPVKYRGVDVGFVREIGLRPGDPQEVRLLLAIERGTPVMEDTIAILSVQGLTGIAFLDLTGGAPGSPFLQAGPGEEYPVIESGPSLLARLDEAASQMFTNIERVSDALAGMLDEDNREALTKTLASIRAFTGRLEGVLDDDGAARLGESLQALHEVSTALARNADAIERMVRNMAQASDQMPDAVAKLEEMSEGMHEAGVEFRATMREMRTEVEHVSQQLTPQAAAVLNELRQASSALERLADDLERDPALLLHGRRGRDRGPGERR